MTAHSTDFNDRKYRLIERIIAIDDERELARWEQRVAQLRAELPTLEAGMLTPVRKDITLEDILKRDKPPLTLEALAKIGEELDIQEPLEDLLAQLD